MWSGTGPRYAIAVDVADPELADALAEALDGHPGLRPAAAGEADLVIADRPGPGRLDLAALPEGASPALILAAAHVTAAGLRVMPRPAAPAPPPPRLSPREAEVLGLMLDGASNKAIARALGIAERTAKFHVAAVMAKLAARSRAEAVARALREGLAGV